MADYMKRALPNNIKLGDSKEELSNDEVSSYEKRKLKTSEKKWKIICKAKELKKKNLSNVEIGKQLGLCDETVAKYLMIDEMSSFLEREHRSYIILYKIKTHKPFTVRKLFSNGATKVVVKQLNVSKL